MSADNWAVCPRCLYAAELLLQARQDETRKQYGKVTIDEWEVLSEVLTEELDTEKLRTFREDYEFWGAEAGLLHIEYSGECTKCGLKCLHEDTKLFWSPPTT